MKATINGTQLDNGNFMIELDAEQLEDLAVFYLLESCKWDAKNMKYEGDDIRQRNSYIRLAEKYHQMYKAIRNIQTIKEQIETEYAI
jgi:hypothetical protein